MYLSDEFEKFTSFFIEKFVLIKIFCFLCIYIKIDKDMLLKYITLISGFNYLIFSIVLFFKKSPIKRDNQVLGFIFFIMSIYSILISFYNSALIEDDYLFLSYYFPVDYVLIALMGPALYFYLKILLNKPIVSHSWKFCLHVLPLIPPLIYLFYFISLPKIERVDLLINNFKNGIWQINLLNILFYLQITFYLFICYRVINKQLVLSSKISKGSIQLDISWLKTLMIIDLIILFVSAPLCFYLANERVSNIIAQLAMDIQLIYIFFKIVWQTGVFPSENIPEVKSKETVLKIADQLAEDYLNKLKSYMEENKPYLLEDCTIMNVSEQTGISVHHLSNILNQRFDKNFSEFINEYRVNEAKAILDSPQSVKMTLEAIGYECGFGSKASFNKAFKKHTNLTPSQYRQQSKS